MDAPNRHLNDPAQLRRSKRRATGLLVAAAVLFVLIRLLASGKGWTGYVEAAAEAAMIGGLADWFAVTALFRHPLGIPIPHTAIIPRRKDAIGASLGSFVQDNFFDPETIGARVAEADLAANLGDWLADGNSLRVVSQGTAAGDLGRWLETALDRGQAREAISNVVAWLDGLLEQNYFSLRERVVQEAPRFTPRVLDHHVYNRVHEGVRGVLADMLRDEQHELRLYLETRLRRYARRLQTDPNLAARLQQRLDGFMAETGQTLQNDADARARVDRWLQQAAVLLARYAQDEVADIITRTVQRWEADDTSARIEERVGTDLQFIRINGTVIGALAGLAIHAVAQLL